MDRETELGSFISRKKQKVISIFRALGNKHDEQSFITLFKEQYPEDWKKINNKWEEEERNVLPGKKHPMQIPDTYMKEMYRNWKQYFPKE